VREEVVARDYTVNVHKRIHDMSASATPHHHQQQPARESTAQCE
jgi:hypothetical protein